MRKQSAIHGRRPSPRPTPRYCRGTNTLFRESRPKLSRPSCTVFRIFRSSAVGVSQLRPLLMAVCRIEAASSFGTGR
jgi:hypothetical protein